MINLNDILLLSPEITLVIGTFVVIIVVLVFNTFNYYHELGYDGQHHKYNMEVLPLNLPTEEDTKEFFNPPLPYLVPSVADKICDKLIAPNINNFNCSNFYGNVGQLLQSLIFNKKYLYKL